MDDRSSLILLLRDFSAPSRSDWDGEGALSLSNNAIQEAVDFVENLPQHIPLPEATPDPRGRIGLEWHMSKHRVLLVTFGGTGSIAFTAMFGRDDYLSGLTPCAEKARILDLLSRLQSHRNPQ